MWLFLAVPWVSLQCVIVVFPDHTHLMFYIDFGDTGTVTEFGEILQQILKLRYVRCIKLFITSLVIAEYSISSISLLRTDLYPLKFPLYNIIFTYEQIQ